MVPLLGLRTPKEKLVPTMELDLSSKYIQIRVLSRFLNGTRLKVVPRGDIGILQANRTISRTYKAAFETSNEQPFLDLNFIENPVSAAIRPGTTDNTFR